MVCSQVNHLGPYLLTRLLERVLVRSAPSRVVNVSSCTHCYGVIGDPWYDFLLGPQGHFYEVTPALLSYFSSKTRSSTLLFYEVATVSFSSNS